MSFTVAPFLPVNYSVLAVRPVYNWKKIKEETGSLAAKTNYQRGHGHKIVALDKFKELVKANSGLTLEK